MSVTTTITGTASAPQKPHGTHTTRNGAVIQNSVINNILNNNLHIGILDIYGFERLSENSFEQLCINLANERLQQFFIDNVLQGEQSLYAKEGLPWSPLPLPDSFPTINSIKGILRILDDHTLKKMKNLDVSDENFTRQVHENYVNRGGNPAEAKVKAPKLGAGGKNADNAKINANKKFGLMDGFVINHYAGDVLYTTHDWFDKNSDRLISELESCLRDSKVAMVKALSSHSITEASSGSNDDGTSLKTPRPGGNELKTPRWGTPSIGGNGKDGKNNPADSAKQDRFISVGKKYCEDLEMLCKKTLEENTLHYIRCFNPNSCQKAGFFDRKYVLEQTLQSGTVELVQMMYRGYPFRMSFEELKARFLQLLPEDFQRYDRRTFVESVMFAFGIDSREYALGVSRLFLKAGQLRVLESLKESNCGACSEALAHLRRQIVRKKWKRARTALCLCLYLPKYMREIRREKTVRNLRSACFIYVRLYRWLNWSRGLIRRRFLEEQRKKQARKLTRTGGLGLFYSHPKAFVCKGIVSGQENLIFTNGKSLFCSIHTQDRSSSLGPVYKVNIRTGKICDEMDMMSSVQSTNRSRIGTQDSEAANGSKFPDVSALAQHPRYPYRFLVVDVEGHVFFVDWQGIRVENPKEAPLYSVATMGFNLANCWNAKALADEAALAADAGNGKVKNARSSGTVAGRGSAQARGSTNSVANPSSSSSFSPDVAITRLVAYLPYDITKRNIYVALIETVTGGGMAGSEDDDLDDGHIYFLQLIEVGNGTQPGNPGVSQKIHDTKIIDTSTAKLRIAKQAYEKKQAGISGDSRRLSTTENTNAGSHIFHFLNVTQSGRMVVLGGNSILNCYHIKEVPPQRGANSQNSGQVGRGQLKLSDPVYLSQIYMELELRNLRSCICVRRDPKAPTPGTEVDAVSETKEIKEYQKGKRGTNPNAGDVMPKGKAAAAKKSAKDHIGDFIIVGASDGTMFGFPFTYCVEKTPDGKVKGGKFIFDEEGAGMIGYDGEDSDPNSVNHESLEGMFPIHKGYHHQLENRFCSLRKNSAMSWLMGTKDGVHGWHPQEIKITNVCDNFPCAVSSRMFPNYSLFVTMREDLRMEWERERDSVNGSMMNRSSTREQINESILRGEYNGDEEDFGNDPGHFKIVKWDRRVQMKN